MARVEAEFARITEGAGLMTMGGKGRKRKATAAVHVPEPKKKNPKETKAKK